MFDFFPEDFSQNSSLDFFQGFHLRNSVRNFFLFSFPFLSKHISYKSPKKSLQKFTTDFPIHAMIAFRNLCWLFSRNSNNKVIKDSFNFFQCSVPEEETSRAILFGLQPAVVSRDFPLSIPSKFFQYYSQNSSRTFSLEFHSIVAFWDFFFFFFFENAFGNFSMDFYLNSSRALSRNT